MKKKSSSTILIIKKYRDSQGINFEGVVQEKEKYAVQQTCYECLRK